MLCYEDLWDSSIMESGSACSQGNSHSFMFLLHAPDLAEILGNGHDNKTFDNLSASKLPWVIARRTFSSIKFTEWNKRILICTKPCYHTEFLAFNSSQGSHTLGSFICSRKKLSYNFVCIFQILAGFFQDIFLLFSFSRTFPGLEIYFFHFPGFQGFPGAWEPWVHFHGLIHCNIHTNIWQTRMKEIYTSIWKTLTDNLYPIQTRMRPILLFNMRQKLRSLAMKIIRSC